MVSRAFTVPTNSEEFLAIGDYMLYASTTFMQDMIRRVKDLSVVACNISQYAELPTELWDACATSIQWIQDISFVFMKYSTTYESRKLVAEETLAKVISTLIYDLDDFLPNLMFLDRIDDNNKLYEYKLVMAIFLFNMIRHMSKLFNCLQFINTLQRKIEKFDNTFAWINKEEELFNKELSKFPELDEIKVC